MKFTTIIALVFISMIAFYCHSSKRGFNDEDRTNTTTISEAYSDEEIDIKIKEVSSDNNKSKTSISTTPHMRAEAKNASLLTILKLVMNTDDISINNRKFQKKHFDFELKYDITSSSNDSIIASKLLPLLGVDFIIIPLPKENITVRVQDSLKFQRYLYNPEHKDLAQKTRSTQTKISLSVENYTLDALLEKLSDHFGFKYTIKDSPSQTINYQADIRYWKSTKHKLIQDLGLHIDTQKIKTYRIIIE